MTNLTTNLLAKYLPTKEKTDEERISQPDATEQATTEGADSDSASNAVQKPRSTGDLQVKSEAGNLQSRMVQDAPHTRNNLPGTKNNSPIPNNSTWAKPIIANRANVPNTKVAASDLLAKYKKVNPKLAEDSNDEQQSASGKDNTKVTETMSTNEYAARESEGRDSSFSEVSPLSVSRNKQAKQLELGNNNRSDTKSIISDSGTSKPVIANKPIITRRILPTDIPTDVSSMLPRRVIGKEPIVTTAGLQAIVKAAIEGTPLPPEPDKAMNDPVLASFDNPEISEGPQAFQLDLAKSRSIDQLALSLPPTSVTSQLPVLAPHSGGRLEKHEITYEVANEQQRKSVDYALAQQSFCLIGSAGTGKTTTQRLTLESLIDSGFIRPMGMKHKYLPLNAMGVIISSLMNKAVNNMRIALPDIAKPNAITIHKLLEYSPVPATRIAIDDDGNEYDQSYLKFEPLRNPGNLLTGIQYIIIEESSTVGIDLFAMLLAALPNHGKDIVFIFLGDLKQLPPPFGKSILTKKLRELPYVELTKVYRQALDSPIIRLAVAVNEGKPISDEILQRDYAEPGRLKLINLSGKLASGKLVPRKTGQAAVDLLTRLKPHPDSGTWGYLTDLVLSGEFVPFRDVILSPYRQNHNSKCDINCDYMNQVIANAHGQHRKAEVFEVRAGFTTKYLAIGDPVMHKKEEYTIIDITPAAQYKGLPTKLPSVSLTRWGDYLDNDMTALDFGNAVDEICNIAINQDDTDEEESAVRKASHVVRLKYHTLDPNSEKEIDLATTGDIAELEFAYCLTVHKALGSEWDSVYCLFHCSHMRMLTRELVYTGMTRAKHSLTIVYDGQNLASGSLHTSTLNKAILTPEIKGITIEEKLDWLDRQEMLKNEDTSNLLDKYK